MFREKKAPIPVCCTVEDDLMRLVILATAMAIALPVGAALAQAVTTYDGTYKGVSLTMTGGNRECVAPGPVPGMLRITNGAVEFPGAGGVTYQGTVTAQGTVSARSPKGGIFTGKVEGGKVSGGTNYGANCTGNFVWQK
jgi:hypothetical protein